MATMLLTSRREVVVVPVIDLEASQELIARITTRAFDLLPGENLGDRRGALLRVSDWMCVIAGVPTAAQQAAKLEAMRMSRRGVSTKPIESNQPLHPMVTCSQCGRGFGPGKHGFSHCQSHKGRKVVES